MRLATIVLCAWISLLCLATVACQPVDGADKAAAQTPAARH